MIFLGMSSSRFRGGLFGNGSLSGSPLFKYMASSQKRRRHAMAFGAFFGDGTGSGLSSKYGSNESLPSGPDSLDEDIEAGGNDEDYDSADSLDDDSVESDNAGDKKKDESSDEDEDDD